MRKKIIWIFLPILLITLFAGTVLAISDIYTVQKGDSLWKIAVKYQIGLSEIIGANPQIKNPALIYPGDKVTVPNINEIKTVEAEVIRLTNLERVKNGLPELKSNWELSRVARYKSADMRDNKYFGHTSPVYGGPFQMISDFGIWYSAAGENIAKGYASAAAVVQGWMNSSGHRANILNAGYTHIGVGLAIDSYGTKTWTQMFIRE